MGFFLAILSQATKSQRLINRMPADYDDQIIKIGGSETYEARCINCHEVPGKPVDFWKTTNYL